MSPSHTNKAIIVVVYFACSITAAKEYSYNIYNDIHCISKNNIPTEEACKRWQDNMNKIHINHIYCKEITSKDNKEQRACSPTIVSNNDVITKLSYRWNKNDLEKPITVEIDYTGLSYKEQKLLLIIYTTCFIGLFACFYINGCPDCSDSYDDDNFVSGLIIGNLLSDSSSSSSFCNDSFSIAFDDN